MTTTVRTYGNRRTNVQTPIQTNVVANGEKESESPQSRLGKENHGSGIIEVPRGPEPEIRKLLREKPLKARERGT